MAISDVPGFQEDTTSTTSWKPEFQFHIFPNPAHEEITILHNTTPHDLEVSIVNLQGKIVESYSLPNSQPNHTLSVHHLNSGIYFLRLTQENGAVSVKKLVIE